MRGCPLRALAAGDSEAAKQAALENLERDVFANTVTGPRDSHMKTWTRYHHRWFGNSVPVLPLTSQKLRAVGAMFKEGAYRSFQNYLTRIKDAHVEAEFLWTDELARAARHVTRSVLRGIGEGRQSAEYNLVAIAKLNAS